MRHFFLVMINKYHSSKFCREDITLIENYEQAIADSTQTWHCHHRRETIFSKEDLIEIGEYYNRPAAELIFLPPFKHLSLHHKGKPGTRGHLGHKHSEKTKLRISNLKRGRKLTESHKQKLANKIWINNGEQTKMLDRNLPIPNGWNLG